MHTIIEEIHSDENMTLGPTANPEPFRLGLPLRPSSPPHSSNRPADVASSQRERTTANATAPRDTQSSPVAHDSPSGDADDSETLRDDNDEYLDSPLPTPRRIRARFRTPKPPAQEWEKHVFRLLEMGGRR